MASISMPIPADNLAQMQWLLENWDKMMSNPDYIRKCVAIRSKEVIDVGDSILEVMDRVGAGTVVWQISEGARGLLKRIIKDEVSKSM